MLDMIADIVEIDVVRVPKAFTPYEKGFVVYRE